MVLNCGCWERVASEFLEYYVVLRTVICIVRWQRRLLYTLMSFMLLHFLPIYSWIRQHNESKYLFGSGRQIIQRWYLVRIHLALLKSSCLIWDCSESCSTHIEHQRLCFTSGRRNRLMVIFCQYQIMNELDTSRTKISFKPFLDICGAIHYFGCALLNLRQKINGLIMSVGWAEMGRGKSWDIICLKTLSGGAMLTSKKTS